MEEDKEEVEEEKIEKEETEETEEEEVEEDEEDREEEEEEQEDRKRLYRFRLDRSGHRFYDGPGMQLLYHSTTAGRGQDRGQETIADRQTDSLGLGQEMQMAGRSMPVSVSQPEP